MSSVWHCHCCSWHSLWNAAAFVSTWEKSQLDQSPYKTHAHQKGKTNLLLSAEKELAEGVRLVRGKVGKGYGWSYMNDWKWGKSFKHGHCHPVVRPCVSVQKCPVSPLFALIAQDQIWRHDSCVMLPIEQSHAYSVWLNPGWYVSAWEGLCALHPIFRKFLQHCCWNLACV